MRASNIVIALVVVCPLVPAAHTNAVALHYRFIFTAVAEHPGRADGLAISELELLSNDGTIAVAAVTNPGGHSVWSEGPEYATDGKTSTKFCDLNFNIHHRSILTLTVPVAATLEGYRIYTASDAPKRDPTAWRVEVCATVGECTAESWHVVHTVTFVRPPFERRAPYGDFWVAAPPPPSPPLPTYVLSITAVRDSSRTDAAALGEIRFYSATGALLPILNAESPDGESPRGQGPLQAIDGDDSSMWIDLNFRDRGQSILRLTLRGYEQVAAYEFITGRDALKRDPTSWVLSVVTAAGTLMPLSIHFGVTPPAERSTSYGSAFDGTHLTWPPPSPQEPPQLPPWPPAIPPPSTPPSAPPPFAPPLPKSPPPPLSQPLTSPPPSPIPLISPISLTPNSPWLRETLASELSTAEQAGSDRPRTIALTIVGVLASLIILCSLCCCALGWCVRTGRCPKRFRFMLPGSTVGVEAKLVSIRMEGSTCGFADATDRESRSPMDGLERAARSSTQRPSHCNVSPVSPVEHFGDSLFPAGCPWEITAPETSAAADPRGLRAKVASTTTRITRRTMEQLAPTGKRHKRISAWPACSEVGSGISLRSEAESAVSERTREKKVRKNLVKRQMGWLMRLEADMDSGVYDDGASEYDASAEAGNDQPARESKGSRSRRSLGPIPTGLPPDLLPALASPASPAAPKAINLSDASISDIHSVS